MHIFFLIFQNPKGSNERPSFTYRYKQVQTVHVQYGFIIIGFRSLNGAPLKNELKGINNFIFDYGQYDS